MNVTMNALLLELNDFLISQYLRPDPLRPRLHHLDQSLDALPFLVSAIRNCPHNAPSNHQK